MRNYTRLMDILDRVENGPIVEETLWDMQLVPEAVNSLLKKYQIKMKPPAEEIVPSDDDLADRLFQAGLELVEELGAFCVSTSRRIQFSQAEILDTLEVAPLEVTLGDGNDRHTEKKRRVEDPAFPDD